MKMLFVLMILICFNVNAQNTEFKVYENGLIYSENSVTKLKHIVDSLNLKFKVCEFNKTFLSYAHAKANFVKLEENDVLKAKEDIENNISYSEFKAKYPKANFEENLIVINSGSTKYTQSEWIHFSSLELGKSDEHRVYSLKNKIESFKNIFKGKWIYSYDEKAKYSNESLRAFYFVEEFKTKPIADKYARLIQYSDCLVDTTAQIFYDGAKDSQFSYLDNSHDKVMKFKEYVNRILRKASLSPENWESLKFTRCDSLRKADSNFSLMLDEALAEAKVNRSSDDGFEEYVGRYISKDAELELKRNRRVIGGCSMDNSPRVHALNIAMLSAETIKWEIFLRSHLNIMNDRFDRASDGSYAQKERNTYIKEIEVLDINVLDLILGISLRIENPSKNHYFSSINRVGRALAESSNPKLIETTILDMIADNDLDDYNRVVMYYLFDNYNYNLSDENAKNLNQTKLQLAVSKMPDYISSRIITGK